MMNASPTSRPIFVSRVMATSHAAMQRPPARARRRGASATGAAGYLPGFLDSAELGRTASWVAGQLVVGGGHGLFREDADIPGLLRRPKGLLHESIFHRLKTDHRHSAARREQPETVLQERLKVLHLRVHLHPQRQEGPRGRIDFLRGSTPSGYG